MLQASDFFLNVSNNINFSQVGEVLPSSIHLRHWSTNPLLHSRLTFRTSPVHWRIMQITVINSYGFVNVISTQISNRQKVGSDFKNRSTDLEHL